MKSSPLPPLISLIAGSLFGFGLALSDMISPARVQWFFDVFGAWDPTLLFVMVGGLSISLIGHFLLQKQSKPLLSHQWHFPWQKTATIDTRLITGSILFGIGWALAGLCPGPAIGSLMYGESFTVIFVISMLISMGAYKIFIHR